MALVDGQGVPLGIELAGANRAEVKLVDAVLYKARLGRKVRHPKRLIADRAYDSEPLRRQLRRRGIEPLIPARRNNAKATGQDGRRLRRYRHRWKVERTWVAGPSRGEHTSKVHTLVDGRGHTLKLPPSAGNVVDITRYDKLATSFLAFVSLSAILH